MALNLCFLFKFTFISSFLLLICRSQTPHRQFQYKYSFKGPYLAQKDGTVPFWEYEGSTIASEEMVRITPSLKSKKGSIWTKNQTSFPWWEIEMVFRINGRGRLGADGLAFWYTDHRGVEGPVFGANDKWNGLGVFFDSFDNDGKGNNPYIMVMMNDGSKVYDHQTDGINQQIAGCQRDFRNKPFPVRARIEYFNNVLTVMFHNGNTNNEEDYELCLRSENVFLPQFGHFGISAATGALADDHDVLKFLSTSLHPPGSEPTLGNIGDADKEKFSKEYEQYKEKLERQKDEYRKQHPDEAREREMKGEDEFESQQQLELKQIFSGQSQMFEVLKSLHRKMDEVIGREERVLSMLTNAQMGAVSQGGHSNQPPVHTGQPASGDSIRRHEIEAILGNQREMVQSIRDVRAFVTEIHQRSQGILASLNTKPAPQDDNVLNEVREQFGGVKRDLANLLAKSQQAAPCPNIPPVNCVSPMIFIGFTALAIIILLGYQVYKGNKEAQSKKFY